MAGKLNWKRERRKRQLSKNLELRGPLVLRPRKTLADTVPILGTPEANESGARGRRTMLANKAVAKLLRELGF